MAKGRVGWDTDEDNNQPTKYRSDTADGGEEDRSQRMLLVLRQHITCAGQIAATRVRAC